MNLINKNSLYLIFEKGIKFINGVIVSAILARYFGPEQFGIFNTNVAIVMLFYPIVMLGTRDVLIYELKRNKEKISTILTICSISFIVALSCYVIIIFYDCYYNKVPIDQLSILKIISLSLFLLALEPLFSLVISEEKGNFVLIAGILQTIFSLISKLMLVYLNGDLNQLGLIFFLELVSYYLIFFIYFTNKTMRDKKLSHSFLDKEKTKKILKQSLPLMISGLLSSAYMRLDILMIEYFLGYSYVGQYSLAVRLIESIYFIPAMLVLALYPKLIDAFNHNDKYLFNKISKNIFKLTFLLSILFLIFYFLFAKIICDILFGPEYYLVHNIVYIYGSVMIFTFQVFFIEKLIFMKFGSKLVFYSVLSALIFNILSNFLLIPIFGVYGAAYSTIISQLISCFLFYYIHPRTRETISNLFISLFKK